MGSDSGLYHTRTGAEKPVWENEFFLDKRISDIFPGTTGLYTTSYGRGFYKEVPGSNIWIPMNNNLQDKTVITVLESPDKMLFVGCKSGVFKSTNGGKTWKLVLPASGKMFYNLAISGKMIYAVVAGGC